MDFIIHGFWQAISLIARRDPAVVDAALRSLWVSSLAVGLAAGVGILMGMFLARLQFTGRGFVVILFRAGMAVPTVLVGLVCYGFFCRRGPLGAWELLYSPWAIVAGEFLLAVPIVTSLTHVAVQGLDRRVGETARTLGVPPGRRLMIYLSEARGSIMVAVLTAFARCITELGVALMVGGNIKGLTRTLATATALETARGEFALGAATSMVLLGVAMGVMTTLAWIGQGDHPA